MGKAPHPRARANSPGGIRAVVLLAVTAAACLLFAAPALAAFTHPTTTNVKDCFQSFCHGGSPPMAQFSEWAASSPYKIGALRGHNVTMAQTLLDKAHNHDEGFVENCTSCHSPFSFENLDATTATLSEFVKPLNQVGPWSLVQPYRSAVATSTPITGFYFPADHPTPTSKAGWEGISCRVCHDTATLVTQTNGDQLPKLRFFDASSYAYVDVASATELCQKCHQAASDDDRTAPAESVHAGIPCTTCHMTKADGTTITHTLNAGKAGDPLASTACNQCHATAMPVGHPDVTTLTTSFTDPAKFAADPLNPFNPADRKNVHLLTCDACHQPSPTGTFAFVFGTGVSSVDVDASLSPMTSQFAPKGFDDPVHVIVWRRDNAAPANTTFTVLPQPITPGLPLTVTGIAQNTQLYFTQATAAAGAFPGLGRGVLKIVMVKANITIAVSKARVHLGASVVISGKALPLAAGKTVVVQKSRNGKTWKTFKKVAVKAGSKYSVKWTAPAVKGKYFFRCLFVGNKAFAKNVSKAKVVKVF
jgi:hypothetical protein